MSAECGVRISDCRRRLCSALFAALLLAAGPGNAGPTAKAVLVRASAQYDAVRDYVVDAKLTAESPSTHVPEMKIKIYYKQPNKVHVESKDGFAMFPRHGAIVGNPLRDMVGGTDLVIQRSERVLGADCYLIKGSFKREGYSAQASVWIEKAKHLVRQVAVNPEWGPSVSAKLWYTRVGGRYWLPSTTVATVSTPPIPNEDAESDKQPFVPMTVRLRFANYRVNTGLDDKIFRKPEGSK